MGPSVKFVSMDHFHKKILWVNFFLRKKTKPGAGFFRTPSLNVYYTHTYLILQSGFQVSIGQPLSLNRYLLLFIHNQILWFDPWQQIYRPIPASELQYCHRSSLPGSGNKILSGTLCEISLFQFPRV